MSDQIEARERSLASVKRARQKENRSLTKEEVQENLKPVKRDINIPEVITVRELALSIIQISEPTRSRGI